jgi:hypothetical protein
MLSSQAHMYLTPERPIKRRLTFDDACVPPGGLCLSPSLKLALTSEIGSTPQCATAKNQAKSQETYFYGFFK